MVLPLSATVRMTFPQLKVICRYPLRRAIVSIWCAGLQTGSNNKKFHLMLGGRNPNQPAIHAGGSAFVVSVVASR